MMGIIGCEETIGIGRRSWREGGEGIYALGDTHYCSEIRTRCLCSLGRWPMPVELHLRFEVRQLEHGESLSHRTWTSTHSATG